MSNLKIDEFAIPEEKDFDVFIDNQNQEALIEANLRLKESPLTKFQESLKTKV